MLRRGIMIFASGFTEAASAREIVLPASLVLCLGVP